MCFELQRILEDCSYCVLQPDIMFKFSRYLVTFVVDFTIFLIGYAHIYLGAFQALNCCYIHFSHYFLKYLVSAEIKKCIKWSLLTYLVITAENKGTFAHFKTTCALLELSHWNLSLWCLQSQQIYKKHTHTYVVHSHRDLSYSCRDSSGCSYSRGLSRKVVAS